MIFSCTNPCTDTFCTASPLPLKTPQGVANLKKAICVVRSDSIIGVALKFFYCSTLSQLDDVGAGKLREMLTLHTNRHAVHCRFTPKDDCECRVWNAGAASWTQRENYRSMYIGVRAGGARGAAAPPNFGQLRFFGQLEKIWAKPVFKDVSMFLLLFWRDKYFLF